MKICKILQNYQKVLTPKFKRSKRFENAVQDYTRALRFASDRSLVADLYSNRSIVLNLMKMKDKARLDIENAEFYGYG